VGFYYHGGAEHGFLAIPASAGDAAGPADLGSASAPLSPLALANATFTLNQTVGDPHAERGVGLSDGATGQGKTAGTARGPVHGTGGRIRGVSTTGKETGRTGDALFARHDNPFLVEPFGSTHCVA
jgi:hypothetical protein